MTYRISLLTPPVPASIRGLRREMDRAFETVFSPVAASPAASRWSPATDIVEEETGWIVTLDVPGIAPEALEVVAEERVLTVRGTRAAPTLAEGAQTVTRERPAGAFERRFRLPTSADAEQLTAEVAHGVLTLRIGKVRPAQPRRVPIQAAAPAAADTGIVGG
jgi:HSP20 family protein